MRRPVVLVDAHRGASSGYPENTLSAFRAAIDAGVDSVELDVRLTADRRPVVIHDETVDRTTDGSGAVSDLALFELRTLDAGSWKDAAFRGERLPTLDETLDTLESAPRINMELKTEDPALAELAAAVIERRRLHHRIMTSSFHLAHLVAVKKRLPGVWCHLFCEAPLPVGFWEADGRFVNSVGLPWENVSEEVVGELHRNARAVWTYTVDDPDRALELAAAGVQAITTNDPVTVIGALGRAGYR